MFKPKISVTGIPPDASSMVITDITGNWPADPTGYDAVPVYDYTPYDNTIWYKLVQAQKIGTVPGTYPFEPEADKTAVAGVVPIALTDGVWLITQYFAVTTGAPTFVTAPPLEYTVDVTEKILTRTSGPPWVDSGAVPGLFSDVYAISDVIPQNLTIDDFSTVASLSNTTLTLNTAIAGLATNQDLTLIFRAQKYILVMNAAEQSLISDIGDMAISELTGQGCNHNKSLEFANRLMIKLAAQIAFNCGNFQKAHNASVLFLNSKSSNYNCSDC